MRFLRGFLFSGGELGRSQRVPRAGVTRSIGGEGDPAAPQGFAAFGKQQIGAASVRPSWVGISRLLEKVLCVLGGTELRPGHPDSCAVLAPRFLCRPGTPIPALSWHPDSCAILAPRFLCRPGHPDSCAVLGTPIPALSWHPDSCAVLGTPIPVPSWAPRFLRHPGTPIPAPSWAPRFLCLPGIPIPAPSRAPRFLCHPGTPIPAPSWAPRFLCHPGTPIPVPSWAPQFLRHPGTPIPAHASLLPCFESLGSAAVSAARTRWRLLVVVGSPPDRARVRVLPVPAPTPADTPAAELPAPRGSAAFLAFKNHVLGDCLQRVRQTGGGGMRGCPCSEPPGPCPGGAVLPPGSLGAP